MDDIDATTAGTLSPHILPIIDLQKMLAHIEESLLPTLHLLVSSEDTLHFYHYLHTHVLIAHKQFLLLINVPIQDWLQQLSIYKIFTLVIPHGNLLLAMISALSISELHRMKSWQWKSHHVNSGFVNKQMDSFVPFLHHFNHLQIHHLVILPCMLRIQPAFQLDVTYRSGNHQMSVCPLNLQQMFGF